MEIIQERLRREFDMDVISTYPSVIYQVDLNDGTTVIVDHPTLFPEAQVIHELHEPVVNVCIMVPGEYIGDMMQLVLEKRGEVTNTETIDEFRVMLSCVLPLAEILVDFNDRLKSSTKGYGSMDCEHAGYRSAKVVKMDMLIAGDPVEAFSTIVHRDKAEGYGRTLAERLKEVIPSHLFVIAIQAAVGGKIVARESISAMRKARRPARRGSRSSTTESSSRTTSNPQTELDGTARTAPQNTSSTPTSGRSNSRITEAPSASATSGSKASRTRQSHCHAVTSAPGSRGGEPPA